MILRVRTLSYTDDIVRILVSALILCLCSVAGAADPGAEPVVVTVSAEEIPLSAVSASVTILSREYIENSQASSVVELLQSVPFLHVSQTGRKGGLSTVTIRGGDPNFTSVMIDGVQVNDPTNLLGGAYDFSTLSTDQIDRIEIVRGPLSSVYGSEAMSGVIQIITRQGKGSPSGSGEVRGGNFGSWSVRGDTQGEIRGFSYSAGGSFSQIGEQTENDSFELGTFSVQTRGDFGNGKLLRITARYHDSTSEGFPENGGGPEFSILRDLKLIENRQLILGGEYIHRFSQDWLLTGDFEYYNQNTDSFTPEILDAIPPGPFSLPSFAAQTEFDRGGVDISGHWKKGSYSAVVGAGWKEERGDSIGVIADFLPSEFSLDRTTRSIRAEFLYHSARWNVSAGIRTDDSDGFETEWSPRLGLSYLLSDSGTRFRGSWGEAYKLPSFFALAEPNTGNPDLLPEQSRGFDFGMEQDAGPVTVSISYYYNSFHNLIDFSPDEFRLVNRNLAVTQGIELEANWNASESLRFQIYAGYLNADLRNTDEPLRDRPEWSGGANMEWDPSSGSRLQVTFAAVGDRFDFQIPVPDIQVAESYGVVSAAFTQDLSSLCKVFVRADNLLDNDYSEFVGFPNPGLSFQFGFQFRSAK